MDSWPADLKSMWASAQRWWDDLQGWWAELEGTYSSLDALVSPRIASWIGSFLAVVLWVGFGLYALYLLLSLAADLLRLFRGDDTQAPRSLGSGRSEDGYEFDEAMRRYNKWTNADVPPRPWGL